MPAVRSVSCVRGAGSPENRRRYVALRRSLLRYEHRLLDHPDEELIREMKEMVLELDRDPPGRALGP